MKTADYEIRLECGHVRRAFVRQRGGKGYHCVQCGVLRQFAEEVVRGTVERDEKLRADGPLPPNEEKP